MITVLVGPIQFKDHATSRLLSTRTGWAATLVEDDNDSYDAGVVVGVDSKPEGEQRSPG